MATVSDVLEATRYHVFQGFPPVLHIMVAALSSIAIDKVQKLFLYEMWFLLNSTLFWFNLKIDAMHGKVGVYRVPLVVVNHDLLALASTTMPALRNGGSMANADNAGDGLGGRGGIRGRGGSGESRGSRIRHFRATAVRH